MEAGLAVGCEEANGGWVGCRGVRRRMEAGLAAGMGSITGDLLRLLLLLL